VQIAALRAMSHLRVRPIDLGELDGADELLDDLPSADEALDKLSALGEVDRAALSFGDGWAAAAEIDGTSVIVRGEPPGKDARWSILGQHDTEGSLHAARRLNAMVGAYPPR
jgi:hypothetical protein